MKWFCLYSYQSHHWHNASPSLASLASSISSTWHLVLAAHLLPFPFSCWISSSKNTKLINVENLLSYGNEWCTYIHCPSKVYTQFCSLVSVWNCCKTISCTAASLVSVWLNWELYWWLFNQSLIIGKQSKILCNID